MLSHRIFTLILPLIFLHTCTNSDSSETPTDLQLSSQYQQDEEFRIKKYEYEHELEALKQEQETLQNRIQVEKQNSAVLKAFCLTIAITALIIGAGIGSRAHHHSQKGEIFAHETISNPPTPVKPTARKPSARSKKPSPEQQIIDQT